MQTDTPVQTQTHRPIYAGACCYCGGDVELLRTEVEGRIELRCNDIRCESTPQRVDIEDMDLAKPLPT
jgi:hypothetical protein